MIPEVMLKENNRRFEIIKCVGLNGEKLHKTYFRSGWQKAVNDDDDVF